MSVPRHRRRIGACLAVLGLLASAAFAERIRNHFDADTIGRTPGFFDFMVLGAPGPARWIILSDPNPPSPPNRLAQVEPNRPPDSIGAAIRRNYAFQDGTVSTFLRRGAGHAGLLLRFAGEKDFLVLLVDTGSGEAVLTSFHGGQAAELGRGRANLSRDWEKFSVTASGSAIAVLLDDRGLFDATDSHPVSGRAGLATTGPGETSFDEFVLEFDQGLKP